MKLYRITREKYATDLSGEGAKLFGGRWNRPGVAALYASEARSLALLELLVHYNAGAALKMNYVFVTLEIAENNIFDITNEIDIIRFDTFNNEFLWNILDSYFFERNVLAIKVPSIIVPKEFNVIINPKHELTKNTEIVDISPAVLDPRLIKNL